MEANEYWKLVADLGSGYSNIRALGEGGMGTIFSAHKDSLDVDVVIKKIKKKFAGRLNERAEANILKRLKHKYLPRIYDVIESPDGYIYTIMDLIPGENMQQYISAHGPADQKTAYRWACQLCEVIDYLHSQTPPILHCDIKPSNIMIMPTGDICLIDFNTSLVFSDGVLAIGATPGYAAPEQYTKPIAREAAFQGDETLPASSTLSERTRTGTASSRVSSLTVAQTASAGEYGTISKRTDVYSAGATLYYAVTGVRPNRSLEPVKPLRAYKLKLSRTFQDIIQRAMCKQPQDRFCDAREMLHALQDIHTMDARYKSLVRTQWIVTVVCVLCALAGAGILVLGINLIHQENDAAYDQNVRRGRTAGEETRFEEAEGYLDAAIRVYDNRLEAYAEKAVLLYRQGRYEECIDAVSTIFARPLVCDSQQEWANVCYVAANSYYELGDYENAVLWYREAIGYSPSVEAYYRDCAVALAQQGETEAVRQILDQMLEQFPDAQNSLDYQMVCAELNAAANNKEEALAELKAIVRQSSDEQLLSRAYVMAAQIYETMGDEMVAEEIALLEEGMDRLSGSYRNLAGSYLGMAYVRQADLLSENDPVEKALTVFCQMRDNGLNTRSVRLNIAVLQQRLGQYDAAAETLEELAEDYPNDYRVYKRLAFLYAELESQNKAGGYPRTKEYYELAVQYYQAAQAAGTADSEMVQLKELVEALK